MDDAVFDPEDMVGIGVQAFGLEEGIEVVEVLTVEEDDGGAMRWNVLRYSEDHAREKDRSEDDRLDESTEDPSSRTHDLCPYLLQFLSETRNGVDRTHPTYTFVQLSARWGLKRGFT